jgi:hypothetical protein
MYTRKTSEVVLFPFISLCLHALILLFFARGVSYTPWEKIAFYIPKVGDEAAKNQDYITYINLRGDGGVERFKEAVRPTKLSQLSGGQGGSLGESRPSSINNLGLKSLAADVGSIFKSLPDKSPIDVFKSSGDIPVNKASTNNKVEELSYQWKGDLSGQVINKEIPLKKSQSNINLSNGVNSTSFNTNDGSTGQGNNASIGVVIPKGVKEEALNKWQMVLYSFHKRVFSQYLTQLYLNAQDMERIHPYHEFPYVREPDSVRVKSTYEADGTLVRVEKLKHSDSRLLNEFFLNTMQDMNTIPNPPKLIINENGQFDLIFEVKVVY